MIYIDLDADLNMEDDDGRDVATIAAGAARPEVGSVLVAGRPTFWSWVVIGAAEENADGSADVTFHQVSAKRAASVGPLVVDVRRAS